LAFRASNSDVISTCRTPNNTTQFGESLDQSPRPPRQRPHSVLSDPRCCRRALRVGRPVHLHLDLDQLQRHARRRVSAHVVTTSNYTTPISPRSSGVSRGETDCRIQVTINPDCSSCARRPMMEAITLRWRSTNQCPRSSSGVSCLERHGTGTAVSDPVALITPGLAVVSISRVGRSTSSPTRALPPTRGRHRTFQRDVDAPTSRANFDPEYGFRRLPGRA